MNMGDILDDKTIEKLKQVANSPENNSEIIDNGDRKIEGAMAAIDKKAALDETVESNLSSGLIEPEFAKASEVIDKKRKKTVAGFKHTLKLKKNAVDAEVVPPFEFDDVYLESVKELEKELTDPFVKEIYSRLAQQNKFILIDHLVDNQVSREKSETINKGFASDGYNNVVAFSDNGYLMQLNNKKEIENNGTCDIKDSRAKYTLIAPDGTKLVDNANYNDALETMGIFTSGYHQQLVEEFDKLNNSVENNLEDNTGTPVETGDIGVEEIETKEFVDNSRVDNNIEDAPENPEVSINKLEFEPSPLFNKFVVSKLRDLSNFEVGVFLETQDINRSEVLVWNRNLLDQKCIVSFSSVGYLTQLTNVAEVKSDAVVIDSEKAIYNLIDPKGQVIKQNLSYNEVTSLLWSESKSYLEKLNEEFEANKEEIEKELADSGSIESSSETLEPKLEFQNPFSENVSRYAESIGIKSEELATNSEFLTLTPEQQKFVLETLRRSSLAKATAEGHENFINEKNSKKVWQIGFSFNQSYHKERHKVEALKNIESQGLSGYSEGELNLLMDVIKKGPEIKMNEAGDVIVDCLPERFFREDQTELVTEYNEVAREYMEATKGKDEEAFFVMQKRLNNISFNLLNTSNSDEERNDINYYLLQAKNNVELIRFLSADKETEKLLDKMSQKSFSGLDKAKAMVGAQKDKAGYAALGFTLRTGTKFALANSACLASAISYGVGPMVAAIVGGFRGYNTGKKELIEKEELAKLGIKDQSSTAKSMNLATGKEGSVNFGLNEKLQNLIDKLNSLDSNSSEEESQKIIQELNLRVSYTENRINSGNVDYGSVQERNSNYINLVNTLAMAKSMIGRSATYQEFKGYWVSDDVKKLTRGKGGAKNISELYKISASERLASFMNYREEKQHKKELNFLIKKTATGAVLGATFAAAGAFVAEKLGIGNWLSEHFSKGGANNNHLEQLVAAKSGGSEAINNTSGSDISHIRTGEVIANKPVSNTEMIEATPTANKVVATPKLETLTDEISNKGLNGKSDSVWRSTREIFKNNAKELGYKGNLEDDSAINRWAETQTAKTIANSGEINDKIFEGNKVTLTKSGDEFVVKVEQGSGLKPAELHHEVNSLKINQEKINPSQEINLENNNPVESDSINHEAEVYYLDNDQEAAMPSNSDVNEVVTEDSLVNNQSSKIINDLHLRAEDLKQQGDSVIYQRDFGSAQFDYKNGNLELKLIDKNGSRIPDKFINEIRGKSSLNKFVGKGLDKTLKAWSNLDNNDRSLYQLLSGNYTKNELLNQIKIQFNLDDNIKIAPNNQFAVRTGLNKQEYFSNDFKGIKKMLKVIAKLPQ